MSSTSDDSEAAISSPQLPTCWSPNSGRAYTFTEIASSTNKQLHQLDSGRCLLSCEKTPREAVHLVPRNLKHQVLVNHETSWKKSPLNLNSAQNLVTLCTDMHISFNNGDWALVPTEAILNKILKNKNHTFDKPYRGFNPNGKHDYVYVRVPQEEDEEDTDDMDTDEEEDDEEDDEDDECADEYEYVQQGDTDTAMDGNPELNIPIILKHHAHPFYAIHNALQKLRKRFYLLNAEHFQLYYLMQGIDGMWMSRLVRQPSQNPALKRRRPPSAGSNDNNDTNHRPVKRGRTKAVAAKHELGSDPDRTNTREIRDSAKIGKGNGRARGIENTPSRFRELLSATSSESDEEFFDDRSEIAAWAEDVAAVGPSDVPDETIVWLEKERVRKPIQEWHRWHTPYNQPKERSKFSSSDWSMFYHSKALWMPSLRKRKK